MLKDLTTDDQWNGIVSQIDFVDVSIMEMNVKISVSINCFRHNLVFKIKCVN